MINEVTLNVVYLIKQISESTTRKLVEFFEMFYYVITCSSLISSSFDSLYFVVTGIPYSESSELQDSSTGSLIRTLLKLTDMLSLNKK